MNGIDKQTNTVTGFEKLWVWQKAHQLMLEVHEITKKLPDVEKFRIRDQIERSSSSVPDNIAEGHSSYYYNEKIPVVNPRSCFLIYCLQLLL